MNRTLLCVLAALFLAAWAPQNVSAQWTGTGPHTITTAAQLKQLADNVNAGNAYAGTTFELGNNIDLSSEPTTVSWTPIGNDYARPFSGTFDGQGNTISNLTINVATLDYVGLFGRIDGGTVKNLALEVDITAKSFIGGVVGSIDNGSIEKCYVSGSIEGKTYVGGVAGEAYLTTIKNCSADGDVKATSTTNQSAAGGIVGSIQQGSVADCYSTCDVSGGNTDVGGVAGYVENGSVANCYATGAISGTSYVGGIVGSLNVSGSVNNCAALNESVHADNSPVGRVAGSNGGTMAGNVAWDGMNNGSGGAAFSTDPVLNGSDRSSAQISTDASHGGIFAGSGGWNSINSGHLPGFTADVNMPAHLSPTATTYTVTYNLNGGTGTLPTEANKAAGATFAAAAATGITAPIGKQFKQWNTAANGSGTAYAPGANVTMPGSALTLYAIWENIPTPPTPTDPTPDPDLSDIYAAVDLIQFTIIQIPQEAANTETETRAWLEEYLRTQFNNLHLYVSVTDIRFSQFEAAIAGSAANANGTHGAVTFSALLSKGIYTVQVTFIHGRIVATPYVPSTGNEVAAKAALKAVSDGATLAISGLSPGEDLRIYSAFGQLIYKGRAMASEAHIQLNVRGTLIVVSGQRTLKVFVK